jgi:apolipoprotein N-acyltransferase
MLGAVLLLGALALYGPLRLQQIETMAARTPTMKVSIIQGNIPQEDKWEFDQQTATIELYLDLSGQAAAAGPELIVWPETALPFYPLGHPLYRPVASFPFQHDLCLLAGAPHRELDEKGLVRYYNSALLIAPDEPEGRLAGIYHKQHLVPFGEYIPLRRLLPFFAPVVETLGDFSPGTSPYPLACGERRLGILICFEAIFPRLARQVTVNGADLLINITNDAWFGPSNAPWQHLSMAALRAVENRRSLARAANTGISAFITPDGRIHQATDLFTTDQRSADLPLPLISPTGSRHTDTIYRAGGYLLAPFCLLLLMTGIIRHIYVNIRSW